MVWDAVKDEAKKWPKWPNPFECNLREFKWWHCGQHSVINARTVGECIADFWWTEIFPSQQEIFRKFVSGPSKCGFRLKTKAKKGIGILWGETPAFGPKSVVGSILRPATTAAFAWWASNTPAEALSMFQTIIYIEEAKDFDGPGAFIPNGTVPVSTVSGDGSVPLPESLCEQTIEHAINSGGASAPTSDGYWEAHFWGLVDTNGGTMGKFEAWIETSGPKFEGEHFVIDNVGTGVKRFEASYAGKGGVAINNRISWEDNIHAPFQFPYASIAMFVIKWGRDAPPGSGSGLDPCNLGQVAEIVGVA